MPDDPAVAKMVETIQTMEAMIRYQARANKLDPVQVFITLRPELECQLNHAGGNPDTIKRMLDLLKQQLV